MQLVIESPSRKLDCKRLILRCGLWSMGIISFNDLPLLRERHSNQKVIYCSGSFDLLHAGHVLFFEECRKLGDILVVGIGNDEAIRKVKGFGRPILNQHLRLKMISSLRIVDYCFLDPNAPDQPLEPLEKILWMIRPHAYVVNDDAYDIESRRTIANKAKVPLVELTRTSPPEFEGVSATRIIEKIRGRNQ